MSRTNLPAQSGGSDVSYLISTSLSNSLLNFSTAPSSLTSKLTVSVPAGTTDADYVILISATYMRPEYVCSCAPKDALTLTVPVDVVVSSPASSAPTILGLQPIEFYGIIAAVGAGAVIAASYLIVRRGKRLSRAL